MGMCGRCTRALTLSSGFWGLGFFEVSRAFPRSSFWGIAGFRAKGGGVPLQFTSLVEKCRGESSKP